jgi:hypothetical protein
MPSNNWIFQIDSRGKYCHYNREGWASPFP